MTKLKYKLTALLLIGASSIAIAENPLFKKEITREVHKSFDVSSNAFLDVWNKYGDINISTWDKNIIQIDVLLKVKSSDVEKAQKFLDATKIQFETGSKHVTVKTVYPDQENNSSWWSGWWGNNKNIDYEVHYTIKAPADISSKLNNKYGNITQTDISGDVEVVNKYGDIFFGNIGGSLNLDLGYGKATVGKTGNAEMQVKYSSIKLLGAEKLNISSKYSDFKIKSCLSLVADTKYDEYTIESVGNLNNKGKYDEWKIGSVNELDINTVYSDITVGSLQSKGSFDTKYGHVKIGATGNNIGRITIDSDYTDYEIRQVNEYHINFFGSYADLKLRDPYERYHKEKDGSKLVIKAFRGSKKSTCIISADMSYGSLEID